MMISYESSKDDFIYSLKDTVIDDIVCFQLAYSNEGLTSGKIKIFVDQKDFITIRNDKDEDADLVMILRSFNIKLMNGVKMATQLEVQKSWS